MKTPSSYTTELPAHVRHASWISAEDKDALAHGFSQLTPAQQRHALNACFDCGQNVEAIYDFTHDAYMNSLLASFTD
jgi:hypothetical protein